MPLSDIILTKEDFAQSDWQNVIADSQERECQIYSTKFFSKASEADKLGDTKAREVFRLLGAITFSSLRSDSRDEPFASRIVNDFSDAHLDLLKELVPEISDPEMQARVADILWVRKRDFRMAQIAVKAYLESARNLENPQEWSSGFDRIERAINLAALLGKKAQLFNSVIVHIESLLDKYDGEDPLFLSVKLMELLQKYRQGDPVKYAALSEQVAIRAESEHSWQRARDYWQIKAQWHLLQNDLDSQRAALLLVAETYVKESEDALNQTPPSYQDAYTHIEKAIEALRRIGGTKERVEQLHKFLIEYQQKAVTEMKPAVFTSEVNLSECVERAREKVKDKTLDDALLTLAAMGASLKVDRLRKQVKESASQFRISELFPEVLVNEMGKTIARKPSMLSNNPDEIEEAIRAEMFKWAKVNQQLYAQGVVEPARYQINLEHNVRLDDWFRIVSDNPLVPPNREYTYARGLDAGLKGDFLVAAHLLIPQLENSVRYLLNQRGVITSTFDDKGIQNERDLNTLLYSDEIKEIFSEDILFDLQGLLINRFGSNLRNRMAHGLINDDEFSLLEVSYLWWFTLHLCCLPILAQMQRNADDQPDTSQESGDAPTS